MPFFQDPPRLSNTYEGDPLLRELLARTFSEGELAAIEPELAHLGALAAGPLFEQQLAEREHEPRLTAWDAWGRRVDRIEPTPLWREAAVLAARHGLVATAYEARHGARSRIHQLALAYLLDPSTDVYSCPLAMTRRRGADAPRRRERHPRRARGPAAHLARSGPGLDERPVDDRADRRVGRVGDRDRRPPGPRRRLAALRDEVVQLGDHRRDGPRARAPRGEPARLPRARPVPRRDAARGRDPERRPREPAQGQARDAQAPDRRADPRRRPGDAGRGARARRPHRRAHARGHPHLERRRGGRRDAARPRPRPRLRPQACGLRDAPRCAPAPRGHPRDPRGGARGGVPPRLPRRRAPRGARGRRGRRSGAGSSSAS